MIMTNLLHRWRESVRSPMLAESRTRNRSRWGAMTAKPHTDLTGFLEAVDAAIAHDKSPDGALTTAELDTMAAHVGVLLEDAAACYFRHSYGTSVFLSVTALEETAKAEMLAFRGRPGPVRTRKDPMLDHASKHKIAVRPTTFMSALPRILGDGARARLQKEAEDGALKRVREEALYVHLDHNGVSTPAAIIGQPRARELLLLALVAADDVLVGWTHASYVLGERFDALIKQVAQSGAAEE